MHIFFRMADGSHLAFFDLGDDVAAEPSPNTPAWVNHIALRVDSLDGAARGEGAPRGGRRRGARHHRPPHHRVDLLLRPERHPPRADGADRERRDDGAPRARSARCRRGVDAREAARRPRRQSAARPGDRPPKSPTGARWMPERRERRLAAIDVKPGAAMESQSGLQMLRPRIYGAYEKPSRRDAPAARRRRRDRHAPDEQLHGPLPDRPARRARHRLPGPQLALRRQRHGAADGARDPGPRRRREVHARALGCDARRPGRQLGRRRARRLLPGPGRAASRAETLVDGDPTHLSPADLPPVDGIALCAAHEGRSHLLLRWIDPSLVDEHDALSVDPSLDMYDRRHWADGAAAPPRFRAEFLRPLHARRSGRAATGSRHACASVSPQLRATPGAPRDESFVVYRTHADPRCLDLTPRRRTTARPGSVWGDARAVNYSANAMGRTTSLTAFLSQWSSASRADGPENLARTSVPVLLLTYTADQSTFPSTRDAWLGGRRRAHPQRRHRRRRPLPRRPARPAAAGRRRDRRLRRGAITTAA